MTAHPLLLALPGGVQAELIHGSRPPRYAVDGQPIDVDVTIPDDLARAWHWHGTFLSNGQIGIFTGTFPPPQCFVEARRFRVVEAAPQLVQLSLFEVAA